MSELYTSTLKYFWLAIKEFLPGLAILKDNAQTPDIQEQLEDLIEAYNDIAKKISSHSLNFKDPNRTFEGEPFEIEINITEQMVENLARLSQRLLGEWKKKIERLKRKEYLTEENKEELDNLKELIWPLEALIKEESYVLGRYADKGPLVFPGEEKQEELAEEPAITDYTPVFPRSLIELIPGSLKTLCEEFDFNYKNKNPNACMLLLRKIIPLAIVRRFQQINKEEDIKADGEFLQTKGLLGKAQGIMSSPRIYDEISNVKFLIDGSQHIFSLEVYIEDVSRPALAVRIMLQDFFSTD